MPEKSDLDWLDLPPSDIGPVQTHSLIYGAQDLVADYVKVKRMPSQIQGIWVHGWIPDFWCVDPDIALSFPRKHLNGTGWVGTKGVERYLLAHGCKAKAIGLPIAYLPKRKYQRRKGSLLVMPSHSLEYTKHGWNFRRYAQEISEILHLFDQVVVCLHAGCLKNGYWVKEFNEIGVPVIEGANPLDRNALERVRALMSQFEYVTTNGFGSHIAYGAAFGAKVSIYGTFCEYEEEDLKDDYFYCDVPGSMKEGLNLVRESFVRQHLGEFFCHPREAVERVEWGLEQIGYHNRISPREMRLCFGLEWYREPVEKWRAIFLRLAKRLLPHQWYCDLEALGDFKQQEKNKEIRRLEALPPESHATAIFEGKEFHFLCPKQFLEEYLRIFHRGSLDFPCVKADPVIIDWGSGTGLGLRFWADKFPAPEIHVLEPGKAEGEVLLKNMELAPNAKITIHKNAAELVGLLGRKVDFLRLDVGAEGLKLFLSAKNNLANVDKLMVFLETALGRPQQISHVLAALEERGFRYYLSSRDPTLNALLGFTAKKGADCRLEVWACKGEKFPRMRLE